MTRTGWNRPVAFAGRADRVAGPLLALAIAAAWGGSLAEGRQIPPAGTIPPVAAPAPVLVPVTPEEAGPAPAGVAGDAAAATPGPATGPTTPVLPDDVQVIRFQGPEGMTVEVLGPAPEPVPQGDGKGLATVGLKVGIGYKLRLSNLPDRPGVELFPIVEVVGHLHRPKAIDPAKYPIRILFRREDIEESADQGRLVTQAIYLEDPEQAVPLKLPKDEPPYVNLSPAEDPYQVARALGRVMAIVRIGGRMPTPEELSGPAGLGLAPSPCPFMAPSGGACQLPCGPVCGSPPPPDRSWMPRDEFLCDGGDRGEVIHFGGDGGLRGIDPRDTVVQFRADDRSRVLPTNVVCVYAPRFASVRLSIGLSESLTLAQSRSAELLQRQAQAAARQGPKKLAMAQNSELNRIRAKASGLGTRISANEHSEIRILGGYDGTTAITTQRTTQSADRKSAVVGPVGLRQRVKIAGLKSAESPVATGIVVGASQAVMTWTPREVAAVEVPPRKPGLAVIKRVDAEEAEPGDTLTYIIQYRNMGNAPIRTVSITDSLMPRLEYVPNSAQGPLGTVFTFGENRVGALELRWDLPGAIPPGSEGSVTFKAVVR